MEPCITAGTGIEETGFGYTMSLVSGKYKMIILYWLAERSAAVVHRTRPRGRFAYFAAPGKVGRRPGTGSLEKKTVPGGEMAAQPREAEEGSLREGRRNRSTAQKTNSPLTRLSEWRIITSSL